MAYILLPALSPWLGLSCILLLAYLRSNTQASGNSPYPHIYGSLLILCIIIPALLGFSPSETSSSLIWVSYFLLWLVPLLLFVYSLLLSPLHVFWSPVDLLTTHREPFKSTPPAQVLYSPETSGYDPQDITAE